MSEWDGDFNKVYSIHSCPSCGESSLRMIRGSEQYDPTAYCGSCGALVDVKLSLHTDDFSLISDDDAKHPGDATINGHDDVTVRDVVNLYEDSWTRYEIADELGVSVKAVMQAIKHYIREAGRDYDRTESNFIYHFAGGGTDDWRDEWDLAGSPWDIGPNVTSDDVDINIEDDESGELRIRTNLQMLKHEQSLQGSVELVYDHPDPRESEVVEVLETIHCRIPNGYYLEVQEEMVDTAEIFARYYKDNPET